MQQFDGQWRYDATAGVIEWSVGTVNASNRNGSMEVSARYNSPDSFNLIAL